MAVADENELLALPIERAAKLAAVSLPQLRYWDATGLVKLLVVAAMRRQGISVQ